MNLKNIASSVSLKYPLSTVSSCETGKKLSEAIILSENIAWEVKLSGCMDPKDLHAYEIAYSIECYTKNVCCNGLGQKVKNKRILVYLVICYCKLCNSAGIHKLPHRCSNGWERWQELMQRQSTYFSLLRVRLKRNKA